MLRLAIFADIHGKFLLPFKLVHHYQTLTGEKIDGILQCGDMGAFPDKNRMDKATLRHAQRDRDELGFYDDFVTPKPEPDILITHDKSSDSERGYGSAEIAELLDKVAFSYHFYGHTGEPFSQGLAENGITQSVKVKELEFDKNGKLEHGCMLILAVEQKDGEKVFTLTPVPLNDIIGFMHATWHYL